MEYKKKGNKYIKCNLGDFLVNHLQGIAFLSVMVLAILLIIGL